MSDQWETFCDVGYYHMWRLRLKTERGWNDGFHINTKAEAEGLCELLNKLERELDDAREQRDRLAAIARELTAMIRVNVMWGRFAECSVEQIDEHLKPWNEKIAAVKRRER
jgi:hypothetical protein